MITYTRTQHGDICRACGFAQATWIVTEETDDNYSETELCSNCKKENE